MKPYLQTLFNSLALDFQVGILVPPSNYFFNLSLSIGKENTKLSFLKNASEKTVTIFFTNLITNLPKNWNALDVVLLALIQGNHITLEEAHSFIKSCLGDQNETHS